MQNTLSFIVGLLFVVSTLHAQVNSKKFTVSTGPNVFLKSNEINFMLTAEYQLLKAKEFSLQGVISGVWDPKNPTPIQGSGSNGYLLDVANPSHGYSISAGVTGKFSKESSRWGVSSGFLLSSTNFWASEYNWEYILGVSNTPRVAYHEIDTKLTPTIPINVYYDFYQSDKVSIGVMGYFQWIVAHYKGNTGVNLYVSF